MNRFITFFLAYLFTNIALAQDVRFAYVTTNNGTTSTVDVYMFNPLGGSETVLGFSANIYYDNTESSLTSFDTSPATAAGWNPDISSTAHVATNNGVIPVTHTGYGNANIFDLNFIGSTPTSTPIHVLTIHFDNTTGTAAASDFYLASSSEGHPALEYADDFFFGWPIIVTNLPSAGITPDVDPLPDVKGECSVTLTAPTANSGSITATTSDPVSYTAQGTYSVTWTYSDGSNTTTQNQTVIVSDTVSPTVVTQNITVFLNASGNASVSPGDIDNGSDDNCGVSGYSLDVSNFDCSDIGANTVMLTVTDVNSNSRSKSATVTVVDSAGPTVATQNLTVYLDASGNASITPGDIDNGSSDNCGISGYSLDITSFDCSDIGANTVMLTVTDVNSNSRSKAATVTVVDSAGPTVATQNLTVYLDASGNASITPGDIDNGSSDNCGISGYSLDISNFGCSDIGANTVVLTVTDVNSNTSSKSATVTVVDSTSPTSITQNITAYLDASGNASITPGDVDGGSSDNCGISGYSLDITSFTCGDLGPNSVLLTVTDVNGNSKSESATITVVDTVRPLPDVSPLTATGVGSVTVSSPTATDNCAGSVTGTTSDPTFYNTIGTYSILWTYHDGNGNSTTQTQSVTVLAPTGDDMDNDSLPDSIDPYPTDPNNNGEGLILARVWDDINADGKQNGSEKNNNIEGAYVRLKKHDGGVILQMLQTNADGLVLFRNVPFNTELKLDFVRKSHHEFAQPNQGSDENIDSDASLSNGQTGIFTLISSDKPIVDQDCGQYSPGTIISRVWDDLNGNGIQDAGEANANIEGVKVRLRRASDGNTLQIQYTDADGLVSFTNVQTDIQVFLDFTAKPNHAIAQPNQGSNGAIDSDADPNNGHTALFQILGGNQTIDTIDCGLYAPGTIIAQVWDDENGDGIKSPGENDGVSGVTVRLRRASDNQSMKTGTTDAGGFVTFDNVPADMQVKLEFVLESSFDFTAQNIGSNEDFDSDADPVNGQTTPFQLSAGSQILENQDAGFVATSGSQPRMVEENPTVLVYPNPTTNYVNVEFEGDYDQLMLIDSRGRMISQRRLEAGETLAKLNLEELPEGVYLIRLAGQSGSVVHRVVRR